MARDKVEEAKWKGLDINEHLQQMKCIMMETAQDISGMTKGPRRHKETWWWNEEVAEAVREIKIKYGKWKKENTKEAWKEYKKTTQNAKRVFLQQRKRNRNDLMTVSVKMKFFKWQTRRLKKHRITRLYCIKGASG